MNHASFLYFHGGPGMNCAGERALLGPSLSDRIEFWEEPSRSRPAGPAFDGDRAFKGLVESVRCKMREFRRIRGPFHAIAHSFSAIAVSRVLREEAGLATGLTLVAPTLDFKREIRNILELAASDFGKTELAKEGKLRELLQSSGEFFDEPMQAALALAGEDADLFKHYWRDFGAMGRFFDAWQKQGVGLDLEAFFLVLKDYASDREADLGAIGIPVTVIFGKHDPIPAMDRELELCRGFATGVESFVFDESGHYPHLEEPRRFLEVLASGGALSRDGVAALSQDGKNSTVPFVGIPPVER